MTIITLHHLCFSHCVNLSVIVLDLSIFLIGSLRKIPRSKTITSDFSCWQKNSCFVFTNPSLLVFGGIVCYVGVGTLVKGQGQNYRDCEPSRKDDRWATAEFRRCFMLICWLQSWLMWWMTQVIHYTIGSRVKLISRSVRMRLPSAVTGRYLSSFVPQAIRIHNANFQRGTISIDM